MYHNTAILLNMLCVCHCFEICLILTQLPLLSIADGGQPSIRLACAHHWLWIMPYMVMSTETLGKLMKQGKVFVLVSGS